MAIQMRSGVFAGKKEVCETESSNNKPEVCQSTFHPICSRFGEKSSIGGYC